MYVRRMYVCLVRPCSVKLQPTDGLSTYERRDIPGPRLGCRMGASGRLSGASSLAGRWNPVGSKSGRDALTPIELHQACILPCPSFLRCSES